MSKNKNQHYVSAFYLYHFTNEQQRRDSNGKKRDTKIWHYEKQKGLIKERPIENVATESYIFSFENNNGKYDHSLDENLKKTERVAANALVELVNIVASLKKGITREVEVNDMVFEEIIKFMVWQIRRHPDLVNEIHDQCKDLCKEKEWKLKPKEMALEVVGGFGRDEYSNFESILNKKNKSIIFTTNTGFITTDVPFVRFNKSLPDGIGQEGTEIYFPLASNILLCLDGEGNKKSFKLENDRKFIKSLNVYMAKKSKNYIFGSTKEHVTSIVAKIR